MCQRKEKGDFFRLVRSKQSVNIRSLNCGMECEEGLKVLYEVDSRAGLGGWFERAMTGEGRQALHNGEVQVGMGMEKEEWRTWPSTTGGSWSMGELASLLSLSHFAPWKILPFSGCAVFM